MSAEPRELRFQVSCDRRCSLNAANLPREIGPLITRWFEEGASITTVLKRANEMGAKLSQGSVGRHRKNHMHPMAFRKPGEEEPAPPAVSELDLLNRMIASGAEQAATGDFRITAEQLLRAIELKLKLTQGSVFDAMYEAMKQAQSGGVDLDADAADLDAQPDLPAQRSADESEQGDPDGHE